MYTTHCARCDAETQPTADGLFASIETRSLIDDLEATDCPLDVDYFEYRTLCGVCAQHKFVEDHGLRARLHLVGLAWDRHEEWSELGDNAPEWWEHLQGCYWFQEQEMSVKDLAHFQQEGIAVDHLDRWIDRFRNQHQGHFKFNYQDWISPIVEWSEWGITSPDDLHNVDGRNLYMQPFDPRFPPDINWLHYKEMSLTELADWWNPGIIDEEHTQIYGYWEMNPFRSTLIDLFRKWHICPEDAVCFLKSINGAVKDYFWNDCHFFTDLPENFPVEKLTQFLEVLAERDYSLSGGELTAWWVFLQLQHSGDVESFRIALEKFAEEHWQASIEDLLVAKL